MKRNQYMSLLLLMTASLTGCAAVTDGLSGLEDCVRHKCQAQQAWNQWSWCYDELDHPHHFARGFKTAYRDVIEGGQGCQPTLPPKCYWKSKFQSAEGRFKVNVWFDGYSHGALAAQQDGAGGWSQIPMSPTARMNLHMSTSQPQSFGGTGHGAPPPVAALAPPPVVAPAPPDLPPSEAAADGHLRLDPEADTDTHADDYAVPLRPYE